MVADFFTDYSWIFWIALLLVFVIVEVLSVDFTFLMLAGGCLGGLVIGVVGGPFWAQVLGAGILALLLLFIVRPALKRALARGRDTTPTNIDALLGLPGTVTTAFVAGQGHVKLANGETWTARLSHALGDNTSADSVTGQFVTGQRVVVTAIDGATAIVVPAERTPE